jgi:hypothetical protein
MATSNTSISLPNPFTPLAFLPPDIAGQVQAMIYITIATTAVSIGLQIDLPLHSHRQPHLFVKVYASDWLSALPEELRMARKDTRSVALIPYFLSR